MLTRALTRPSRSARISSRPTVLEALRSMAAASLEPGLSSADARSTVLELATQHGAAAAIDLNSDLALKFNVRQAHSFLSKHTCLLASKPNYPNVIVRSYSLRVSARLACRCPTFLSLALTRLRR